eukprot:scaffold1563_cov307-Prasinococcus_capsulatus_cf.AAC.3
MDVTAVAQRRQARGLVGPRGAHLRDGRRLSALLRRRPHGHLPGEPRACRLPPAARRRVRAAVLSPSSSCAENPERQAGVPRPLHARRARPGQEAAAERPHQAVRSSVRGRAPALAPPRAKGQATQASSASLLNRRAAAAADSATSRAAHATSRATAGSAAWTGRRLCAASCPRPSSPWSRCAPCDTLHRPPRSL